MSDAPSGAATLRATDYARALAARDARFDGLFFVGITTTRVYCRPVCPARVTHADRRRFFPSAAAAELAGFRPCMRCRPELAPGRAVIDAVSRLARLASDRIAAGALNGHSVAELAAELGVSERHLRRALEREIGVSPIDLAQTHRLLMAKRLLADTTLSVTQIAYASGFQSLRRFNATFRERYRMAPSALRRKRRERATAADDSESLQTDAIKLTLSYRAPLAWLPLLRFLRHDTLRGVEVVNPRQYRRVVCIQGHTGVVAIQPEEPRGRESPSLSVWLSQSLVPVIMPLLARVRRLLDLDAEPALIDDHLRQSGLNDLVSRMPGLRVPGAMGGFEAAFRVLLRGANPTRDFPDHAHRVVEELGTPTVTSDPCLNRCIPTMKQVLAAGPHRLIELGVPATTAHAIVAVARGITDGLLWLERGSDPDATRRFLTSIDGITETLAAKIMMRGPSWPDAFPESDHRLLRATESANAESLLRCAEQWRPWRAYAAMHLWVKEYIRERGQTAPSEDRRK